MFAGPSRIHSCWARSGALLPRVPGVLCPCQRNQEERREEHAEQRVDPDERDVEGAHPEAGNEGAERSAKALFHVDILVEMVRTSPCALSASIS